MIHFNNIGFILGHYWLVFFVAMAPVCGVGLYHGCPDTTLFMTLMFLGVFVSLLLIFANVDRKRPDLSVQESFITTVVVWLSTALFGSLPFYLGSADLSLVDSFFQSVSMITTTGANLIVDLESTEKPILFWCSIMQWLGGKGIIIMAMTFMPVTKVGGTGLAQSETIEKIESHTPRFAQTTGKIFLIYLLLTLCCSLLLWIEGVSLFDAFNHALTTISTGGFSTWNNSIQRVDSLVIQLTIIFFMYLGGVTFVLFLLVQKQGISTFYKNSQVQAYTWILMTVSLLVICWRLMTSEEKLGKILIESFFNVTSALTTTGYVTSDYSEWGGLALMVFFFLPVIGGCTGSTSGGIKIYRLQVLLATVTCQLQKIRWPHGVFTPKYGGKRIQDSTIISVTSFFFLYLLTFVILCLAAAMTDLDFLTTISGVIATLTNLGPGLGEVIGPAASYYGLPDMVKVIFMISMMLGRLELIAFYLLIIPSFWRK